MIGSNPEGTRMTRPIPHGPVPSPRQTAWHRRETYGFVHFTVNTFTDREWGLGDEDPAVFAPSALDCRQWVQAAKDGGLTALILTAKHHDGFCLYPTATTDHHIGRSPFRDGKGDVVRELSDACREAGLGFGIYCSPWDRNHAEYGRPGYVQVYHAQWRELLSGYGPLCELWFDGANGGDGYYGGAREKRSIDPATYYRFDTVLALCRELQPEAVQFSDVGPDLRWCGNEAGYASAGGWSRVRPAGQEFGTVDLQRLIDGEADGGVWRPTEVDVSIRPGWFWHRHEQPKTGDELFAIWLASVGRGAGLNLNLTPDQRGLIPTRDRLALRSFRQRVEAFTAIDLARGRPVQVSGTASGHAGHLTDGDRDTWWQADTVQAQVVVVLGEPGPIGGVRIEEAIAFGQRVAAFAIDVRHGGSWFEVVRGSVIGAQRILRLDACSGDAIRLRILDSQAPAVLSRIQVYAG